MKKNKVLSLFLALIMVLACAFCGISEAAQVGTVVDSKSISVKQSQGVSKKAALISQVALSLAITCIMLFITRYTR